MALALFISIGAQAADYEFEILTEKTISDGTKLSDSAIKSINAALKTAIDYFEGRNFSKNESVEVYYNCIETPNGLFCLVGVVSEGGISSEFAAKMKVMDDKVVSLRRIQL